jgi:hypothetical protein
VTNWESGFTSGVTATLIGFLCTILWDIYKYKRDKSDKEKNVIESVSQEISANIEILLKNKSLIEHELEVLIEGRELVVPLQVFRTGFWDLIKVERPDSITNSKSLFSDLKTLYDSFDYINECLKGRQLYKMTNLALTTFHSDVKKQDEILMYQFNDVRSKLDSALSVLENLTIR